MTTLARRFASTPERTATETWAAIIDLLSPGAGSARDELLSASGAIALLIAEEVTRDCPLVLSGSGPQVRIYTVHGDDALDEGSVVESPLAFDATSDNWALAVPVPDGDVAWVAEKFDGLPHVSVAKSDVETKAAEALQRLPVIDLGELRAR